MNSVKVSIAIIMSEVERADTRREQRKLLDRVRLEKRKQVTEQVVIIKRAIEEKEPQVAIEILITELHKLVLEAIEADRRFVISLDDDDTRRTELWVNEIIKETTKCIEKANIYFRAEATEMIPSDVVSNGPRTSARGTTYRINTELSQQSH